jgi:hypothetical protein
MNKKINVLVFPCGSEAALELHASLSQCVNINVLGASSREDHGRFVYKNYISGVPYIQDADFLDRFNAILVENCIDVVFPIHDTVVLFLSENREKIRSKLILGDKRTCRVCREKRLTYELFRDYEFCPAIYSRLEASEHFPVFLKPNSLQGGQQTQLVRSSEELNFFLGRDTSLLMLEYLPGNELTVDCFTDRHGELRFIGPRVRERVWAGISVCSRAVELSEEVQQIAEAINDELGFRGLWYFQVKQNQQGQYKLLEISSRTAGTMNVYRCLGVNFALLSVYDAVGIDVEILKNEYPIVVDRALVNRYEIGYEYDTVYLDYDDTIIVRDRVNCLMMMYIYQLVNKSKKIVLLTQHKGDVFEDMAKYRIDKSLFSDVIVLDENDQKSDFIKESNSIFIDNSFSERLKVAKDCGIPVFDVDAVQCLLDWRE